MPINWDKYAEKKTTPKKTSNGSINWGKYAEKKGIELPAEKQASPYVGPTIYNAQKQTISKPAEPIQKSVFNKISDVEKKLQKNIPKGILGSTMDVINPFSKIKNAIKNVGSIYDLVSGALKGKPTIQKTMIEQEKARESLSREKKKQDVFAGAKREMPKDYKEPDTIGQFFEGLKESAVTSLVGGFGGALEATTRKVAPQKLSAVEKFNDNIRKIAYEHPEWGRPADLKSFDEGGWKDPRWYSRTAGELIPSMASAIGSAVIGGVIGGPAGASVGLYSSIATMEGGSYYNQLLDQGIDPETASTLSGVYGVIASKLETGFGNEARIAGKIFNKAETSSLKKRVLNVVKEEIKRVPKTAIGEGAEEFAQQFAQNVTTRFINKNQDLVEGLNESFFAGAFGGLMFGSAEVGITAIKSGKTNAFIDKEGTIYEKQTDGTIKTIKDTAKLSAQKFSELYNRLKNENKKVESQLNKPVMPGEYSLPVINYEVIPKDLNEDQAWEKAYKQPYEIVKSNLEEMNKKFEMTKDNAEREKLSKKIQEHINFIDQIEQDYTTRFGAENMPDRIVVDEEKKEQKKVDEEQFMPKIDYTKKAEKMDTGSLQIEIDKRVEAFRQSNDLKSTEIFEPGMGPGVRLRNIVDARGNFEWQAKDFKLSRAKAGNARIANSLKKYADQLLYENDPNFRILKNELDKRLEKEIDNIEYEIPDFGTDEKLDTAIDQVENITKELNNEIGNIQKYEESKPKEVAEPTKTEEESGGTTEKITPEKEREVDKLLESMIESKNKQDIEDREKTQKEKVAEAIQEKAKTIKEVAEETKILEPNVRRILGVGAKEGVFERVDKGIYVLKKNGVDTAWVEVADAIESLPRLAGEGFKADMVFLDIPYDTPAVKGGNRGVKYKLLSVGDFSTALDSIKEILKTNNSPIIHMYSQAQSGLKAMQKYNDLFIEKGLKPVGKGQYQKTFKDDSPVTSPNGKVSRPEGILVFTKSGQLDKDLKDLNFTLKRPKGYQTEKPAEMLKAMIEMTTEEGDMVLDPFAGSGVTGAEAIRAGRLAYLIEKNEDVAENITKPRLEETIDKEDIIDDTNIKQEIYAKSKEPSGTKGGQPESKTLSETDRVEEREQERTGGTDIEGQTESAKGFDRDDSGLVRERFTTPIGESEREDQLSYEGKGGTPTETGRGVLDEYFTPFPVIQKMWGLAEQFGFKGGKVLEPSAGIGRFFEFAPRTGVELTAYELDLENSRRMARLFPEAKVYNQPFESIFVDEYGKKKQFEAEYDLVIGNPPYGTHRQFYKNLGEEKNINDLQSYFIKRGLDLTKDGGLLIYIVPSSFLRSANNNAKLNISANSTLVDAYRLPNGLFAGTNIGTDILVFRKGDRGNSNILSDNNYFKELSSKIMGEQGTVRTRFGEEPGVLGDISNVGSIEVPEIKKREYLPTETIGGIPIEYTNNNNDFTVNQIEPTISGQTDLFTAQITPTIKTLPDPKKAIPATKSTAKHLEVKKLETDDERYSVHTSIDGSLDETTPQDLKDKALFMKGKLYSPFNYFQGDIYDKLDKLEEDKSRMDESLYQRQKEGLTAILPPKTTVHDIKLSPNSSFARGFAFDDNKPMMDLFEEYMEELPRTAFGPSSKYEVMDYLDNRIVNVGDKKLNIEIRNRRRKYAQNLFNNFITNELEESRQNEFEEKYNKNYNGFVHSQTENVPLISNISKTFYNDPLKIRDHQKKAIGFLVNKGSGLLAHDVGAGKTMSAVVALNEVIARGWAKRPLVVVPNQTYQKWMSEMRELLPGVKINKLGNMGAKINMPESIDEKSITFITYEGLRKLGLKSENLDVITGELTDNLLLKGKKSRRTQASEETKVEGIEGTARKSTEYFFEDLGFDHITVDEIHNFKNIFTGAKIERGGANEYGSVRGSSSDRGVKLFYLAQHVLRNNGNRNVFGLSATPFTNSPLEIYSMLSLFGRYKLGEKMITNVNDFMSTFMNMQYKHVVKADGQILLADVIEEFKNLPSLQNLIKEFMDFKGTTELDLKRPNKFRKTPQIAMTGQQENHIIEAQEIFDDKDAGGAIAAITEMQNITLSPYMSRYNQEVFGYKEFVENSPKVKYAVDHVIKMKEESKRRKTPIGQIIFMPRGIAYYEHIRDYLVKEHGFSTKEIAFIRSGVTADQKYDIANKFNKGEYSLIIGSDSMKEGIDLQQNSTDLYYLHLPWNPTDIIQAEGRIWRQGNKWENVRIHFPLLENSIDSFLFQKLETKAKRIQNVWNYKGDVLNVADIDPEAMKLSLITDPVKKVKAVYTFKKYNFENQISVLKSEKALRSKYAVKIQKIDEDIIENEKRLKEEKEDKDPSTYYISSLESSINAFIEEKHEIIKKAKKKNISIEKEMELMKDFDSKIEVLQKEYEEVLGEETTEVEQAKGESIMKLSVGDYKQTISDLVDQTMAENNAILLERKEKQPTRVAPGSASSNDPFSDIPLERQGGFTIVPELITLAKQIGANPRVNTRLRTAIGRASESGDLSLRPDIFEDPNLVAKVLGHEIGHIIHFTPPNIKPSTLLRKLTVLDIPRKNLPFTSTEVKEELKTLSNMWRPMTDESDMKYRMSSAELYADFISVLLNNPSLAEEYAPTFYENWFGYIENKPIVKEAYIDLQKMLNGDWITLHNQRELDLLDDLKTAKELDKQIMAEKAERGSIFSRGVMWTLAHQFVDKHIETNNRTRKTIKSGKNIEPQDRPDLLLEELDFIINDVYLLRGKIEPIEEMYKNVGITDDEFSIFMYYKRILGDRAGLANPKGHNAISAQQELDAYAKIWGEEKYHAADNAVAEFQKLYKETFKEGYDNGLYEKEVFEELYNDQNVYVSFKVLDHYLEGFVSPQIMHQIGTLKGIGNTFQATIAKMVAIKLASVKNNTRITIAEFLKENYSIDTEVAPVDRRNGHVKEKADKGIIKYRKNGKLHAVYTDPYVSDSVNYSPRYENMLMLEGVRFINNELFRKAYLDYSIRFILRNPIRDLSKAYKALQLVDLQGTGKFKVSAIELLKSVKASYRDAREYSKGKMTPITEEMLGLKIMKIQNKNEIDQSSVEEAGALEREFMKARIIEKKQKKYKNPVARTLQALGNFIQQTSLTSEAITKITAYRLIKNQLGENNTEIDKQTAAYIRNNIGTPNYTRGGRLTPATNTLFMFSNVAIQGYRSVYEIGFRDSNTRLGYQWRKAKLALIPKILMFALWAGLAGKEWEDKMKTQSKYKLMNYNSFPLFRLDNGKVMHINIPQDYDDQLAGAFLWLIMESIYNKEIASGKDFGLLFASIFPGLTNTVVLPIKWGQYFAGKNPVDDYRGKNLLTDREFRAGGGYALKPMLAWTWNQIFGGILQVKQRDRITQETVMEKVFKTPLLSAFITITDYGIQEEAMKIKEKVQKEQARESLDKQNAIMNFTRRYLNGESLVKLIPELEVEVYGTEPIKQVKLTNLRKQLVENILLSYADPRITSIIYATTNDEKIAIINKFKDSISPEELTRLAGILIPAKILTTDTWNQAMEE
jgi:hypothetical protein